MARHLRILITLALTILGGCATQNFQYWDASAIARQPGSTVMLNSTDGAPVVEVHIGRVQLVQEVKERIERAARLRARLVITHAKEPNAFATVSNGTPMVGLNTGMLDLLGYDEDAYAVILGHEYGHLARKHGEARAQRAAPRAAASAALGFILGAVIPFGGTLVDVGAAAVESAYSRDEEREADREGFDYAVRAGYDPRGAVRLWEKMEAASSSFSIPFLATHPVSQERIETMRRLIAALPTNNDAVAVPSANAEPAPKPVDPAIREQIAPGKTVYGSTDSFDVRSRPYNDADPVASVSRYSGLLVHEVRGEWARVQSTDGTIGWIRQDNVRLVLD